MTSVLLLQDCQVEGRWHVRGDELEVVAGTEDVGPTQVPEVVAEAWLRAGWAERSGAASVPTQPPSLPEGRPAGRGR